MEVSPILAPYGPIDLAAGRVRVRRIRERTGFPAELIAGTGIVGLFMGNPAESILTQLECSVLTVAFRPLTVTDSEKSGFSGGCG